ncbi:MAG: polyphosphate kinase 2, partial [Hyphomicrobiaceae bacterium]
MPVEPMTEMVGASAPVALNEALVDEPAAELVVKEVQPQRRSSGPRHDADSIRHYFETSEFPYKSRMSNTLYMEQMGKLQIELLKAQSWVKESGQKIVILFEGRDGAGKGGTIKRFMEHLNPRGARVVALEKPTERERTLWYFQRYLQHLPAAGEMVMFDRSW